MDTPRQFLSFPQDFQLGTAVAAFQVEGTSGIRNSDWDIFLKNNPDIIHPGEMAPQWWMPGEAEADIDRMAALGMQSQRLSIEWARIEPEKGKINQEALKRYHEIFAHLKKKKIKPMITLNHYVLPQWVAEIGSWESPHIVNAFEKYTKLVLEEFGDVTEKWITINEPGVLIPFGYLVPFFPPQHTGIFSALRARTNMLEAHRRAYRIIKKSNPDALVSMAFSFRWYRPQDKHDFFEAKYAEIVNYIGNLNYIDAVKDELDFIGVNFYTGYHLNLDFSKLTLKIPMPRTIPKTILFGEVIDPGAYLSDLGMPIVPDFFLDLLRTLHKRYHKPIMITENGIADRRDYHRSFYILTHLVALWKAQQESIEIPEYLVWSSVDNLEWVFGYREEYGLIHVDPRSGKRTIRESAQMYKKIAESRGIHIQALIDTYIHGSQKESAKKAIDHIVNKPPIS